MPARPDHPLAPGRKRIRCAIYTRKSSEEGLEQDFNSLHAQREACEAFIRSQRHEGWVCLPQMYDDGGLSGGTLERPALQALLAAVQAGEVDAVVVYKVDRLTRSLADFAKIVEIFDAAGVSFVSVTQQFNTTTSMGRLTLNVLLSFAQFEREVTGERIRDKIAASKQKGMWMGGTPPLGYDAKERRLVVNQAEAEIVRDIFRRYRALRSVQTLRAALENDGICSKQWVSASGRRWGGAPIARGALYTMLRNRLYVGQITHKGRTYPGQHPAIIDPAMFDEVQRVLAENREERASGRRSRAPSLLAGLLYDSDGHRLTPSHAVKDGKRYRYYVSRPLTTGSRARHRHGLRIPAPEIEKAICEKAIFFLADPGAVSEALRQSLPDAIERRHAAEMAASFSRDWDSFSSIQQRAAIRALVGRLDVASDSLIIRIRRSGLLTLPHSDPAARPCSNAALEDAGTDQSTIDLVVPAARTRTGQGIKFCVEAAARAPNPSLVRLLAQAHDAQRQLTSGRHASIEALASALGVTSSYATRLLRLSWLAPDVTEAILDGTQPVSLSATVLMRKMLALPIGWHEQRIALGFKPN